MEKYYVTAITKRLGKREKITKGLTKLKAKLVAKRLRRDMKIAIPKYRFAHNIKIIKL